MTRWSFFKRPSGQEENLMIGWNFPLNEGGREEGINDPGIETFRGKPLTFLSREICQNSLDARNTDGEGPVIVNFSLERIPSHHFPRREEFQAVLKACLDYWGGRNQKTKKFFEVALKSIGQSHIPFLRIGDFNTTGLLGASDEGPSDWHNLIKAVGVSDKGTGKGGSYGIGKFATFVCSDLRTVFYSTHDRDGKQAFQGVATLVTHKSPKREGKTTNALGFYGIEEGNRPIINPMAIPSLFQRNEVGTDIIITGFAYSARWKEDVIRSIISNFFLALHREQLAVNVGDISINKATLPYLFRQYFENDPEAHAHRYYSCLVSEDAKCFSEEFNDLGRVALYVKRDNDGPRKVAMFRNTGMKIKEKGHFRTTIKFAGVFEAQGDPLNERLRSLEPPGHDNWEPDRCDNPDEVDQARNFIRKLYSWINECVKQVIQVEQTERVDAVGIGRFLPDDLDQDQPLEQDESQTEPVRGAIEEIKTRQPNSEPPHFEGGQPSPEGTGDGPTNETGNTVNTGSGGQPRTGGSGGGEGEGDQGTAPGSGNRRTTQRRPLPLERARTYCIDSANAIYRLVLVPKESGRAHIGISYVGEEGWEGAKVLSARFVDSGNQIAVDSHGKIGPLMLEKDKRYIMEVDLNERLRCALGVVADAD